MRKNPILVSTWFREVGDKGWVKIWCLIHPDAFELWRKNNEGYSSFGVGKYAQQESLDYRNCFGYDVTQLLVTIDTVVIVAIEPIDLSDERLG